MDRNFIYQTALACAREAGQIIADARVEAQFEIRHKGTRDLVTSADIAAERAILSRLQKTFPEHRILSEESFQSLPNPMAEYDPLWIIDPIDGTTNFAHGHAHVAVSIAFAFQGKVEVGIVEAPFLGETFSAIRGQGARLHDQPIRCSTTERLEEALIATGFPYDRDDLDPIIKRATQVLSRCRDIRRLGACALDLCWLACGRLDGYYETVQPWDMAAGGLIARESGVKVGTLSRHAIPGDLQSEELIAAAPGIYEELYQLLLLSH